MAENMFDGDASHYAEGDGMLNLEQDQRAFIEEVAYYANAECERRRAAGQDWVLPSVCVAQACEESGFGRVTTVNIFGIKGEGTTAVTSEEYTRGNHTTIVDSFVSHGTIEEDVKLYYDLICGTGGYEGWDIYSAARNNPDPEAAIAAIREAGYATSYSYTDEVTSILNSYNLTQFDTGMFKLDYKEAGYNDGVESYETLMNIVNDIKSSLEASEKKIKEACSQKPKVDYQSIVKFSEMNDIVDTLEELLKRTKTIADEEKYIAEEYAKDDDSALSSFQAVSMATTIQNYAFDDMNEFKAMVGEYQKGSNGIFSQWFEGYVTKNGIESKVVNMAQYLHAVKNSGAILSSDYVVSKVTFSLATEEEEETTTTNNNEKKADNQFRYSYVGDGTGSVVSNGVVSSTVSDKTKKDTEDKKDKEKDKKTEKEEDKKTEKEDDKKTDESEKTDDDSKTTEETNNTEETSTETSQTTTTANWEGTSNDHSAVYQNTSAQTSFPSGSQSVHSVSYQSDSTFETEPTIQPEPEPVDSNTLLNPDDDSSDMLYPDDDSFYDTSLDSEKSYTKIPTASASTTNSSQHSSGNAVVPTVLGIAATGAVGGGAYYLYKKHQNENEEDAQDEEEYEEDYSSEEDNSSIPDIEVAPYSANRTKEVEEDDFFQGDEDMKEVSVGIEE